MMSKGGFRVGSGCLDQIFSLKEIGEKKHSVYRFYRFEENI